VIVSRVAVGMMHAFSTAQQSAKSCFDNHDVMVLSDAAGTFVHDITVTIDAASAISASVRTRKQIGNTVMSPSCVVVRTLATSAHNSGTARDRAFFGHRFLLLEVNKVNADQNTCQARRNCRI
jgi:hypothetical protein